MGSWRKNVIVHSYRVTMLLLNSTQKKKAFGLLFSLFFGAIFEVLSLGVLVPVMMCALDNTLIHKSRFISFFYNQFGFQADNQFMIAIVLFMLGLFLVRMVFALYLNWISAKFSYEASTHLSQFQFQKYFGRGYPYFKNNPSFEIINSIQNIPSFYASGVILPLLTLAVEGLTLSFIIFGILWSDPLLFLALAILLGPVVALMYGLTRNRIHQLGVSRNDHFVQAQTYLGQAVNGFPEVHLARRAPFFLGRFLGKLKNLNQDSIWIYFYNSLPPQILQTVMILGIVIIFLYAYLFGAASQGTVAFISLFAAAAFRVLPAINRLLGAIMSIKGNQLSVQILHEGYLEVEGVSSGPVSPLPFTQKIEFRNIGFQFGDSTAPTLTGVTFTVKKGERIGIIGTSGSGKTTLMNILLRFLYETEGGIFVDGVQVTPENRSNWNAITGYVQQQVFILDGTIRENIAFGVDPSEVDEEKVRQVLIQSRLAEFVEGLPLGVDTRVGEMGAKLSGGQRQRIGIARALYRNSEVLVLDEATSALDMETEREITESIDGLSEENKTLFIIAHRITTLQNCHRILEFQAGRLVREYDYPTLAKERLHIQN